MSKPAQTTGTIFSGRPEAAEARRSTQGWGWVSAWLPAAIACGVIAAESTGRMSASNTSSFLRPIFERIFGHIDDRVWWWGHHIFRKGGHFSGYGVVCLTFLRAWLLTLARQTAWTIAAWRRRSVLFSIGCTFLVAGCDEWHQTYLPGRTGAFSDVMLDTVGATAMCLLVASVFGWWSAPRTTGE